MGLFRKKPVVIEAFLWTGGPDQEEDPVLIVDAMKRGDVQIHKGRHCPLQMDIATLEGTMTAYPGYWIIRGVRGEIYPCKPDIFDATYERVEMAP